MSMLLYRERPVRMDYSLFLRASEGLLAFSTPPSSPAAGRRRFTKSDLIAFGRFLGSRWMADNYRWTTAGLALRLPPYKSSFWSMMSFFSSWSHRSRLLLAWDGKVSAQLGGKDRKSLREMHPHDAQTQEELESQVVAAVETAWNHFREGRLDPAERALGQVPEGEVFHVPPARVPRLLRWAFAMLAAMVLGLNGLIFFKPIWLAGLKPVSVSETEVRAFLNDTKSNQKPIRKRTQRSYPGDPTDALYYCLVLPPTNLFTTNALLAVHQAVFSAAGLNPQGEKQSKLGAFRGAWLLHKAMAGGWVDWQDVGLNPQDMTVYFHNLKTNEWRFRLAPKQAWSWVKSERFHVERIHDFTLNQLRWLRDVHCLDLVDREKLIQQIAPVQTLSGKPPGQPPIHDWRDVRGLFFTPCWPALQDTYFSLAALEILGGLDKIDREACIRGILRRHEGKGYFTSPDSGGFNEYHIDGSARDTIAAYESLRILGAMDRVKDLEKWQFRVNSRHTSKPAMAGEIRTPTWDEVEAWVCQQRWERMLRVRRENPPAPFRSLLEP